MDILTVQKIMKSNQLLTCVIVLMLLDIILGTLVAFKEKKSNSTIGIDGILRKIAILVALTAVVFFDWLFEIDLIGWLPEDILVIIAGIGIKTVGLTVIFSLLFSLWELFSIAKNWCRLKLPIFKGTTEKLQQLLEKYTDEYPTTNKK